MNAKLGCGRKSAFFRAIASRWTVRSRSMGRRGEPKITEALA
jgi:hypothetical protein